VQVDEEVVQEKQGEEKDRRDEETRSSRSLGLTF